ncbi:hypothetical protein EDC56_1963 [Sinobacterium caligoides]|uniref:Copper(I)-binding protein n=1 Tax=Sinobacterium caligoides TaxID=933926 RepID=A0A3N2DNY2_9GAMM|nr:copper chaperone PCu(A)C [Sinobacterium caligoides]ROS01521.1 hypothetical protein EDC56_1963 [Sinobacterium caligoides]
MMSKLIRRPGRLSVALLLLLLSMPILAEPASAVLVEDGYVRELIPGQHNTAAFMTLVNNTDQEQVILAVTAAGVERVELHQHLHRPQGMTMEAVNKVTIAAGERFEFAPGGYHVMLIGVKQASVGQLLALQLQLANGEVVKRLLPVQGY